MKKALSVISNQRLSLVDSLPDKASKFYLIHFVATLRDLVGLEIIWTLSLNSPRTLEPLGCMFPGEPGSQIWGIL